MDLVIPSRDRERRTLVSSSSRAQEGNKGDRWLNGQVTIRSGSYYRLLIEGVIGKSALEHQIELFDSHSPLSSSGDSYLGDIAIDDLRIFENPCALTPADADPSNFIPTTTSTQGSTTAPTGPYDCTFENGICNGWENMVNNRFNWSRVQASGIPAPRTSLKSCENE